MNANPDKQRGGITFSVLLVLFVLGLGSLAYGVTSVDSKPDFALFTVSYLFLLGLSQSGVVFTAMLRLCNCNWGKPWYRLAELATLAYFPFAIAGFLLIIYFAKDDLFYWLHASPEDHLSPWLNFDFFMIRNLGAMLLFYAVAAVYARKSIRVDTAGGDPDATEGQMYGWSPIVILTFVLANTFIAWDFGMMLVPHFHSTVFPIHYWFGHVFAACAAMIAITVVMRRVDGGAHFELDNIRSLGMLITGFTLLWLYFYWAQFFVIWFGNLPQETEPIFRQMYGHYGPFFWVMIVGCFGLPLLSLLFAATKRSVLAMSLIALAINIGVWINKYLMIVPVFSPDNRPFDHWVDIAMALGLLAGFLLALMLLAKRIPVYSSWEMSRES